MPEDFQTLVVNMIQVDLPRESYPKLSWNVFTLSLPQSIWSLHFDRLIDSGLVGSTIGVPREQKMLKGHIPRVMYHRVYFSIRRKSQFAPNIKSKVVMECIHVRSASIDLVSLFFVRFKAKS